MLYEVITPRAAGEQGQRAGNYQQKDHRARKPSPVKALIIEHASLAGP